VIDMAQIELDRLLNCTVDELTVLVKPLSANNCERYARGILGRIGGPSFEQLMIRIIQTAAPRRRFGAVRRRLPDRTGAPVLRRWRVGESSAPKPGEGSEGGGPL
jgi:hypothetical protein